jgi:glycerophosphoryl diester phosphodiesterase
MLAIAHRAGNDLAELREALDADMDLVEADVRYFRGALEVRHLKTLGPWLLWDHPWELVRRRNATFPILKEVLADVTGPSAEHSETHEHAQTPDPHSLLMLDLKGIRRKLPPAVARLLRTVAPGVPVAVCTRRWRMLNAFADDPAVRLVISAGSDRELRKLLSVLREPAETWPGGRRAFGVSIKRTLLTPEVVRELHQNVDRVMTWPVDTPAELDDARRLGVSGVIGKDLSLLRDLVQRR